MAKKTTEIRRSMRARAERAANRNRLTHLATSLLLGVARQRQMLGFVPSIMGSKLVTLALAAGAGAWFTKGKLSDTLWGVFDGTADVALYQLGEGGFANVSGRVVSGPRIGPGAVSALQELTDRVANSIDGLDDYGDFDDDEEDLDALVEGESAAVEGVYDEGEVIG